MSDVCGSDFFLVEAQADSIIVNAVVAFHEESANLECVTTVQEVRIKTNVQTTLCMDSRSVL